MNNILNTRFENNRWHKFQNSQTKTFLSLIEEWYNNVLEVWCGKWYFSYIWALNNKFKKTYGCDVYKDFQEEEIWQIADYVEYKDAVNNIIPYEDNFFDLVFSMDVIEHVGDDMFFIKEHIRTCKKWWKIIIWTPNYHRPPNLILKLFWKLKYPRKMWEDSYGDVIHLREYSKSQLLGILESFSSEISDLKIIPCWFGLFFWNIWFNKMPKMFSNLCQFWFISFTKK